MLTKIIDNPIGIILIILPDVHKGSSLISRGEYLEHGGREWPQLKGHVIVT